MMLATGFLAVVLTGPWTASTNGTDFVKAYVPGYLGDTFPGLMTGEVTYRCAFDAEPDSEHDYFIDNGFAEYYSEWRLNGKEIGRMRGRILSGEFDCTSAIRHGQNLLEVKVASPVAAEKYGFKRKDAAYQFANQDWPCGIMRPVKFFARAKVRTVAPVIRGDWQTGHTTLDCKFVNTLSAAVKVKRVLSILDPDGFVVESRSETVDVVPGTNTASYVFEIGTPRLWDLSTPSLYSLSITMVPEKGSVDRCDVTYGYRDFRVGDDGWFRLNGRRFRLKNSYLYYPLNVLGAARDVGNAQRLVSNLKSVGFNCLRLHHSDPLPELMDIADRIGLLVQVSHGASHLNRREDTPELQAEFTRHLHDAIRQNINHASVIAWELQNEGCSWATFRFCKEALAPLREIDPTRLVFLDSGRWDDRLELGSVANPGSSEWKPVWGAEGLEGGEAREVRKRYGDRFWLDSPFHERNQRSASDYQKPYGEDFLVWYPNRGDVHAYMRTPLTDRGRYALRMGGKDYKRPIYVSETGINTVTTANRVADRMDRDGFADIGSMYAEVFREMRTALCQAFERHDLGEVFSDVNELTDAALAESAKVRGEITDCVQSNPRVCGFNVSEASGLASGLSMFDPYGDFLPHIPEMLAEKLAPLHWCVFVNPGHVFSGGEFDLEAVIVNDGVLKPGRYPIRASIHRRGGGKVWERKTVLEVVRDKDGFTPFAQPALKERVALDEPGEYSVSVDFIRGLAATGGRETFTVSEVAKAPLGTVVETIGFTDEEEAALAKYGIGTGRPSDRILVGRKRLAETEWRSLVSRIEQGATACFLDPEMMYGTEKGLKSFGYHPVTRLPLLKDLSFNYIQHWAYRAFIVIKPCALSADFASGFASDRYFGDTYPMCAFRGPKPDVEGVVTLAVPYADANGNCAGDEIHGSFDGTALGSWKYGRGKVVLSGFRILSDRISRCPVAGKLLVRLATW